MSAQKSFKSVIIVGAGNVGWHYAHAFHKNGIFIEKIISRNILHAEELASKFNTAFSSEIETIQTSTSLVIITLNDSVIEEFVNKLQGKNLSVVHTSGSIPMSVLAKTGNNYGVLYPVQSLTKDYELNFNEVPLCIEASSKEFLQQLNNLSSKISDKVVHLNSQQRKNLHLAAILVNNFSNFLMTLSADFLSEKNISFDLLRAIITLTAEKIQRGHPKEMQTGPAVRGNNQIISEHLLMLEGREDLQSLYRNMSKMIQDYYKD